jgi:hypothetical protein
MMLTSTLSGFDHNGFYAKSPEARLDRIGIRINSSLTMWKSVKVMIRNDQDSNELQFVASAGCKTRVKNKRQNRSQAKISEHVS